MSLPHAGRCRRIPARFPTLGADIVRASKAEDLLVPDLEAGNMLAKQLMYFGGADAAGLVLGARLPVILTSRADSLRVRLASVALARIVAQRSGRAVTLAS